MHRNKPPLGHIQLGVSPDSLNLLPNHPFHPSLTIYILFTTLTDFPFTQCSLIALAEVFSEIARAAGPTE